MASNGILSPAAVIEDNFYGDGRDGSKKKENVVLCGAKMKGEGLNIF